MEPIYKGQNDKSRFIGTLFNNFDLYTLKSDSPDEKMTSIIIRHGNNDNDYLSFPVNINREVDKQKRHVSGITTDEAIALTAVKSMDSFVLKNFKSIDIRSKEKVLRDTLIDSFVQIEKSSGVIVTLMLSSGVVDEINANKARFLEQYVTEINLSRDIVRDSVIDNNITYIPHHECSICNHTVSYKIDGDKNVLFDGACDCIAKDYKDEQIRESDFNSILEWINSFSNWKRKLVALILVGIVPFNLLKDR